MNEFPNPSKESTISLIDRIEAIEPYVAIRLLILQLALAVAVGVAASKEIQLLNPAIEGLANPGTLFDLNGLARFGYPIRELIWSGDWWRIPVGVLLPPQWMLWGIACVGVFPFAKYLEARIGRPRSLCVYLLGSTSIVYLDLLGYSGVTSGGLGMVMATGGATWVLIRFDGLGILTSRLDIPGVGWMILFLIVPIAWIHSNLHLPMDPTTAAFTPLVPSWIALMAAAITGMVCVLPIGMRRIAPPGGETNLPSGVLTPRLTWGVACLWGMTVSLFGLLTWFSDYRLDYRLWKIEPGIQSNQEESLATLENLIQENPDEPFLKKRMAIHHLRHENWGEGIRWLDVISTESSNTEMTLESLRRRGRLSLLNLRGSREWMPWRFSGISGNYQTDNLRILQDQAHTARLAGETAELEHRRTEIVSLYQTMIEAQIASIEKKVAENETLREEDPTVEERYRVDRLKAQLLNGRAYTLAELGGDLESAQDQAREALASLNDPQILDTLGWIEVLRGDFENGAKHLEDALFSPESLPTGTIYYHLGRAYEGLGRLEKAREFFREALLRDLEWWEEIDLRTRCKDCYLQSTSRG